MAICQALVGLSVDKGIPHRAGAEAPHVAERGRFFYIPRRGALSAGPYFHDDLTHPASTLIMPAASAVADHLSEWVMRYCFAGQVGAAAYWVLARFKS